MAFVVIKKRMPPAMSANLQSGARGKLSDARAWSLTESGKYTDGEVPAVLPVLRCAVILRRASSCALTPKVGSGLYPIIVNGYGAIIEIARQRRTAFEAVIQSFTDRRAVVHDLVLGDHPGMQYLRFEFRHLQRETPSESSYLLQCYQRLHNRHALA